MIKLLLATTLVGLSFVTPSFSASDKPKCDEATFTMMNKEIKADTDPKMAKTAAMAGDQMSKAEMAMKAHNMGDCVSHISMAKKDMMG